MNLLTWLTLIVTTFPAFIMLFPPNYGGIAAVLLCYIAGLILVGKFRLFKKHPIRKISIVIAVLVSALLAVSFFRVWPTSGILITVTGILGLPAETVLAVIASVLFVFSIFGIINILSIAEEALSRFDARNDAELDDRSFRRWYTIILVCCILLYAALLGDRYVWYDETYTFAIARHSFSEICTITAADVHPPLYYFIFKILGWPFGYSRLSARIISILPYILTIAFGGIQFKKLFGKRTALLFMGLFFLFPFILNYAVEVRMYSWAAAFVFGNAVYAYRCYHEDKISNWVLFTLLGVCSAYTHYFSLVSTGIVYAILFFALLKNKRKKLLRWGLAAAATILLYLPWLKCFISQLIYKVNNPYLIPDPTFWTYIDYILDLFCKRTLFGYHLLAVFSGLGFLIVFIDICKRKNADDTLLCICALAVPVGTILIGVLAGILVRPVFVIRYLSPSAPLLVVFLALGIAKDKNKASIMYVLLISVLVGAIGYGSHFYQAYETIENELDQDFISEYADTDCYVNETGSIQHCGVLSYYDQETPIYSNEVFSPDSANPYPNLYSLDEFDPDEYDSVLLFVTVGTMPSDEYLDIYNADFIGTIDNNTYRWADVFLLTKK